MIKHKLYDILDKLSLDYLNGDLTLEKYNKRIDFILSLIVLTRAKRRQKND